jgi:hypothetical protein
MEMYQKAEDLDLVRFAATCPACGNKGENRMCTVTVPHFQVSSRSSSSNNKNKNNSNNGGGGSCCKGIVGGWVGG